MKEKEGIIITGNLLSASEKSDKLRHLVNMEICAAKINDPSFNPGPRSLSIILVITLWAAIAAIHFAFSDLLDLSKTLERYSVTPSDGISIVAYLFLFALALFSFWLIKSEPKTYTEKLINTLMEYKPLNDNIYNKIMSSMNESNTLDLSKIMEFIDHERATIKRLRVL